MLLRNYFNNLIQLWYISDVYLVVLKGGAQLRLRALLDPVKIGRGTVEAVEGVDCSVLALMDTSEGMRRTKSTSFQQSLCLN